MQAGNTGLRQFRARVQELYRQVVLDGTRVTQAQLAQSIGISAKELSLRLGGASSHRLSEKNVHDIVRIFAVWGVVTTIAVAEELLDLVGCSHFTAEEWATPPLAQLTDSDKAEVAVVGYPSPHSPTGLAFDTNRLRERLRELYRTCDPYGTGRPPTQADLAIAIGLDRTELNKRLGGSSGKHLSARDGRAIVRTLAAWRALTTRAEAESLLDLMGLPSFSAAEWSSPPLDLLEQITAPHPTSNLHRELTSFVGREREMLQCLRLLNHSPLLTITGVGGIGKTRLALELARRSLPDFPSGVYQVPLAQLSDSTMLTSLVGRSLGLREAGSQPDLELILSRLQGGKTLLVLDNCEHLIAAVAWLTTALLAQCPGLTIIATSRESLGVRGEAVFTLHPLSLPAAHLSDRAALSRSEAVSLFVARAQTSQPGFTITEANAAALAAVCRLLEGIPLAIELTVPLLRTLSAAQIASRMGERLSLPGSLGAANLPPRLRTMRASIAWSYDLLTKQERTLFRRLAVFSGGWSLAAAEVVCAGRMLQREEVLPTLARLVDKSLVTAKEMAGEMRYQMLEIVREYALSRLGEAANSTDQNSLAADSCDGSTLATSGEEQETYALHLEYFLALAEEATTHANKADGGHWFSRLEIDLDNLRAALDRALAEPDNILALRLVVALNLFWRVRGWVAEGRKWLSAALARPGAEQAALRAEALLAAAAAAHAHGDYVAATEAANRGLEIARRLRNKALAAQAFNALGLIATGRTDYRQARLYYSKSLGLWQSLDNQAGMAAALHNLAHIADEQGDYQTAHQLFMRSLSLSEALGESRLTATTLLGLGDIAMKLRDHPAAEAYLQESLILARELGHKRGIGGALAMLGQNAQQAGDYGTAKKLLEESLEQMRELGQPMEIAQILTVLAKVAYGQGNFSRAAALHRESLQVAAKLEFKQEIAAALEGLARIACVSSRPARAVALATAAARVREATHTTLVADGLREEDLTQLVAQMGTEAYATAVAQGHALILTEAVDYALEREAYDRYMPAQRPTAISALFPPEEASEQLAVAY